jgi:hypothetical protein
VRALLNTSRALARTPQLASQPIRRHSSTGTTLNLIEKHRNSGARGGLGGHDVKDIWGDGIRGAYIGDAYRSAKNDVVLDCGFLRTIDVDSGCATLNDGIRINDRTSG